ncbi:prolyl oligopeptidase family serine peptidase [Propionimicrobium sp. PCR01-08-3]|uniref:alpha/beta hydrolase family protein n=1 Tax=Propionimicrobium sp. PCR01-08-3 TaxID=3052086 RepID=UPI00255CBE30|nr:prolyl oligopeptidase family serine peptidase [Propionimicrobium sp. PCR01-08-3]WIY83700.1 prolyl oligopeptidase family serine peptidase [Propionimicrobium sp. PCR01-08-3]
MSTADQQPIIAPYGSWKSPITLDEVIAGGASISELVADQGALYWLESLPDENGRTTVMRLDITPAVGDTEQQPETGLNHNRDSATQPAVLDSSTRPRQRDDHGAAPGRCEQLTPAASVRSRVNEYGGGAYDVHGGYLAWCDDNDQMAKLRFPDGTVTALTRSDGDVRYGDLRVYPEIAAVLAVREDHRVVGDAKTTLVALHWPDPGAFGPVDDDPDENDVQGQAPINRSAETPGRSDAAGFGPQPHAGPSGTVFAGSEANQPVREHVLAQGADFYANPALSSHGRLAWLEWNQPAMPWDSTELKVARLDASGDQWRLDGIQLIAGIPDAGLDGIAVQHPRWNADGSLIFASDLSGHFQLHEWSEDPARCAQVRQLTTGPADHDLPMFVLGNHATAALGDDQVLTWRLDDGLCHLEIVSRAGESARRLAGVSAVESVASSGGAGYAIVQRANGHTALVHVEPDGSLEVVHSVGDRPDRAVTSIGRSLSFDGRQGAVQAWYYPPTNDDYLGPKGRRPPAVLRVHGGPTAMATNGYYPTIQFWTSRGIAVIDVNYSGSAGFGRDWRNRLRNNWGVADVQDCIDAADAAIDAGLIDPGRIAIAGGSAGGFTALRALMDSDRFAAGITRYGVTDLKALVGGHKFEARYLDSLIGPWPDDEAVYERRSPINTLDRLNKPILILQGTDDPVVALSQSTALAEAARSRKLPMAIRIYEGEGHGFRGADAKRDSLAAELSFLAQIFGFTPADDLPDLTIENLR